LPREILAALSMPELQELLMFQAIDPDTGPRLELTLARGFAALTADRLNVETADFCPYLEFDD
jgi:hypothetical protein